MPKDKGGRAMQYFIGIDGGGTKTAVTIATLDLQVKHEFVVGAINVNGGDKAAIAQYFAEIFAEIKNQCGQLDAVKHLCIGAAGISNPEVADFFKQQLENNAYTGPYTIVGDQETALYGAQNAMSGIILIAGTGSICFGVNEQGERHRTGGYGHLIDDEGSGYAIGRDLLATLVQAEDGRVTNSIIPKLVYEQLGLSTVQEIIRFVYDKQTTKKDIAKLAPIMSFACEQGDKEALAIADKAANKLFELIVPVAKKLNMEQASIAIAGSVIQKSSWVREALQKKLDSSLPGTKLIIPIKDAAFGAVLLAASK